MFNILTEMHHPVIVFTRDLRGCLVKTGVMGFVRHSGIADREMAEMRDIHIM
jgi:hypothetical protein